MPYYYYYYLLLQLLKLLNFFCVFISVHKVEKNDKLAAKLYQLKLFRNVKT